MMSSSYVTFVTYIVTLLGRSPHAVPLFRISIALSTYIPRQTQQSTPLTMSESVNSFAEFFLANVLFEHCKSESLSDEGLREIIEQFGLSPNNNNHRVSDYKFFLVP